MSIIMPGTAQSAKASGPATPASDVGLRNLLDHVAAELAAEYVRLMEAAADEMDTQCQSAPTGGVDSEGEGAWQ